MAAASVRGAARSAPSKRAPPAVTVRSIVDSRLPARVPELRQSTLAEGETFEDLLADRSAFEDFDADTVAQRGAGVVRLDQLMLEHLLGAR